MIDGHGPWRYSAYAKRVTRWEPVGQIAQFRGDANDAPARFLTIDADGAVARAGADAFVVGLWLNHADPRAVMVQIDGTAALELGATAVVGDHLKSDADGRGVPTTTAGDHTGAVALEAGAVGDLVTVFLRPGSRYA